MTSPISQFQNRIPSRVPSSFRVEPQVEETVILQVSEESVDLFNFQSKSSKEKAQLKAESKALGSFSKLLIELEEGRNEQELKKSDVAEEASFRADTVRRLFSKKSEKMRVITFIRLAHALGYEVTLRKV